MIPCERVEKALKLWTLSKTSFPTMLYIKCLDSLYLSLPVWTSNETSQYLKQLQFLHNFLSLFVKFFISQKCSFLLSDWKIIWNCHHHSISGSWNCQCYFMIKMVHNGHIVGLPTILIKIIIVSIACWIATPVLL